MGLPDDYLRYPLRRHGMDHDRYDWTMQPERPKVAWPGGARVALWVVPVLEFFPLDMPAKPFRAPGGMVTAYPDLRHYTLRDYGSRVGAFRVFKALDDHGLPASVAINSKIAERYPFLIEEVTRRDWEVIAYGIDMGRLHYGGMAVDDEAAQVKEAVGVLRAASGQAQLRVETCQPRDSLRDGKPRSQRHPPAFLDRQVVPSQNRKPETRPDRRMPRASQAASPLCLMLREECRSIRGALRCSGVCKIIR